MILVGIIAAKSKLFVVHLNVLSYNNCPSIGRYLFLNPVRYKYIYIYIYIYLYIYIYIYIYIYLTNRFHVAMRLFSNRSQMTSKCGKNKKVAHEAQPSVSLMFLPHFDVICDLLLNRRTATWNLFVLYNNKIKIHRKNAFLFEISPL